MRLKMTFANNRTRELWKNFMQRRKEIQNNISSDLYSMQIYSKGFYENFNPNAEFEKWATIEVNNFDNIPNEMEAFTLVSGLYAVFLYKGLPSQASPTFEYIFKTWMPNSKYELDIRPHFEIIGEKYKKDDPGSEEELWIPIQAKK